MNFIHDDFLLHSKTAKKLYHDYAADMPIFDYHCHLSPAEIARNRRYENLTQIWLYGDHYKWRAMRTHGVAEHYITGDASDYEKFCKWAETVPYTLRNPLYHWTHLELKRVFGIDELLNPASADKIYETCNEMLRSSEFSTRNIMRRFKVKVVCTTDDPTDSLEDHRFIAADKFEIKVLPTWRPDKAMAGEDISALNKWIDKLQELTGSDIHDYETYLQALGRRQEFFHQMGCRLSDHGLKTVYAADYTRSQIEAIFRKIRQSQPLLPAEQVQFKSALLEDFGVMDYDKGWTQQFHIGALRNNNSRFFRQLGPDTGFDSIGDAIFAHALARFLDRLDSRNKLAKTILYNLNPRDNYLMAAMAGNFQDGTCPGKIQYGSGWWFLDQKEGMTMQINALSNLGLLSHFVGMLTDSRSFLSYTRHEYFRRILCDIIGTDVENGELPNDMSLLGEVIQNISFYNARNYFGIKLDETVA